MPYFQDFYFKRFNERHKKVMGKFKQFKLIEFNGKVPHVSIDNEFFKLFCNRHCKMLLHASVLTMAAGKYF